MATGYDYNNGVVHPNTYMQEAMIESNFIPVGPNVEVYAYKANLKEMTVDAIAFAVPPDPSQPVGISAEMCKFLPIRESYRSFSKGRRMRSYEAAWFGSTATTKWGVIPVCLGVEGKGASEKQQAIKNSVTAVLKTAVSHGCKYIAFPAFGTGLGNVSVESSACAMYDALFEFFKRKHSLETVHIIQDTGKIMVGLRKEMKAAAKRKDDAAREADAARKPAGGSGWCPFL